MGLSFNGKQKESKRHPLKVHSFNVLKEMGVPVGTVIDVGILSSTYELIQAYKDVPQILIEPIVEFEERIRAIYDRSGVSYELIKVAASDRDGETTMRTNSVRDGVDITHARMTEDKSSPGEYRTVPMRTLDSIVAERNLAKPYLLKIDVDGAELEILKGAESILPDCSVVCIETSITNIYERSEAIRKHGFQLFDLVDICYYNDRLVQMDAIFLNHRIIQEKGLSMYKDGFDIAKWKTYDPK